MAGFAGDIVGMPARSRRRERRHLRLFSSGLDTR